MSLLLSCHSISKSWGSKTLFKNVSFGINRGDKIGLIGPNGSGKSTLLKILADIDTPDEGSTSAKSQLVVAYVPQSNTYSDEAVLKVIEAAYPEGSVVDSHDRELEAKVLLSKLGFKDLSQAADTLSGGWKKRLDIAAALIKKPDLLLLDEPTNHLDLEGILWLEKFLKNEPLTFIVTSHDRLFLEKTTNETIELNTLYPQGIFAANGAYNFFVDRREEYLAVQQQTERSLASKVRGEIDWLRRSPKARTTKSQARVQEAERLIKELSEVRQRNKVSTSKIDFEASDRQTRKLITIKNLSKSLGNNLLFSNIDLTFSPGMRLGIVGPNGSGKTTLLKLIAGEIAPDKGTIKYAEGIKIVYFDQHRQKLDPNATLRSALSPNTDTVTYRGSQIHVNSWAKRFLFHPDRLDLPVKQLSGGERARIAIARLMLQPADILLLDEPTNDLDIPTLETLEESLTEFPGAIALITHDRALLNNVANVVIGLGFPDHAPLLADYFQWEEYLAQQKGQKEKKTPTPTPEQTKKPRSTPSTKLSYKEQKELEGMEQAITDVEKEIARLEKEVEEITLINDAVALKGACEKLSNAHVKLEALYNRWQELER